MKYKVIFLFFIFFVVSWCFYFKLKPNNLSLLLSVNQPTPLSPIYYLKQTRERIQSLFIFGDRDLSEWNFTLSQKRIVESTILCKHNLNSLGKKQLLLAQNYYQKGTYYLDNLINKIDTNYLLQEKNIVKNLIENTCR